MILLYRKINSNQQNGICTICIQLPRLELGNSSMLTKKSRKLFAKRINNFKYKMYHAVNVSCACILHRYLCNVKCFLNLFQWSMHLSTGPCSSQTESKNGPDLPMMDQSCFELGSAVFSNRIPQIR